MYPFLKINNTIYVTMDGAVASNLSRKTLYNRSQRDKDKYGIIYAPDNRNALLYAWDGLRDIERTKISAYYHCSPEEYLAVQPIRDMIKKDLSAESFYLDYKYLKNGMTCTLSAELVDKYTKNASILNAIKTVWENKRAFKKQFQMTLEQFIEQIIKIIKSDNYALPTTYRALISNTLSPFKRYLSEGYEALISKNLGNSKAAKVEDQQCEDTLLKLIEHPLQYDDTTVCYLYNEWAKSNNYAEINPRTVTNWRNRHEAEIMMRREGNMAFNEKYIRQVKGLKPTAPLFLVESDDYNVNLWFEDEDLKNKYARYVSYIVADSCTGLVLGKSYRVAKSPTFEMVKMAWIDAMYYIRSLTGGWYLPFEVKADHWNAKTAHPFFESIGDFVAPALANKHRGYLEQLFGSPHAKRAEKIAAHNTMNYNGNNVTARHTGVNLEVVNRESKMRPMVGKESDAQIEKFFQLLQKMPNITRNDLKAPSREAIFMEKWNTLSEEDKRPISDMQFLHLFGIRHTHSNKITNRGVEPIIGGQKLSYDLPNYVENIHLIGASVDIIYDPYDLSRVLITNDKDIRMIVSTAELQPRALRDQEKGNRAKLNAILSEKKQQVASMAEKSESRNANMIDPESVLMSGMMPKELKNEVEQNYLEQASGQDFDSDFDIWNEV